MTPLEALNKYFGFNEFRDNQLEIINAIINGGDVIALLPTGAGKSLCYQIPALISEGFTLVISPLIALMKDQTDSINSKINAAAYINSSVSLRQADQIFFRLSEGAIKLLYVSPERLLNRDFAERIKNLNLSRVAIDEAHCISEWGRNFRPDYLRIPEFIEFTNVKNISAFTASASPDTLKDIKTILKFKNPKIFIGGIRRANLSVSIIMTNKKKEKCVEILTKDSLPAIIYVSSRKRAESIAEHLNLFKIKAESYHAGLSYEARNAIHNKFMSGKTEAIAATSAFGMGIDKKNIRTVVHYNMPGSIENYYQELGRAGRDGKESKVILLYEKDDEKIHRAFIESSAPAFEIISSVYGAICDYGAIAFGSRSNQNIAVNHEFIAKYSKRKITPLQIDSSLNVLEKSGYIAIASSLGGNAQFKFLLSPDKLKDFIIETGDDEIKNLSFFLLNEFGGSSINDFVEFSHISIAKKLNVSEKLLRYQMEQLSKAGIIHLKAENKERSVKLLGTRVKESDIIINFDSIQEEKRKSEEKLQKMIDYISYADCRFNYLMSYFGIHEALKCGKCDRCAAPLGSTETNSDYISEIILTALNSVPEGINLNKLIRVLRGTTIYDEYKNLSGIRSLSKYNINDIKSSVERLILKGLAGFISEKNNTVQITKDGKELLKKRFGDVLSLSQNITAFEEDIILYNRLREIRKTASKKFNQTQQMICSDEILREIAQKAPSSIYELRSIKGFTQKMYAKLGESILETIREHKSHISGNIANIKDLTKIPPNLKETLELIENGMTLRAIAEIKNSDPAIISMQVESIIEYYPELDISSLIDPKTLDLINDEIMKGYIDLKDLKSRLPQNIEYHEIRIVVSKFMANKKNSFFT